MIIYNIRLWKEFYKQDLVKLSFDDFHIPFYLLFYIVEIKLSSNMTAFLLPPILGHYL